MPESPRSRRCALCDTNWPTVPQYQTCPRCEAATDESWLSPDYTHPQADAKATAWKKWREFLATRDAATTKTIAELEDTFNAE